MGRTGTFAWRASLSEHAVAILPVPDYGWNITNLAIDTLLGYRTQTSPGVWSYTFTVNLASRIYTLFAQAEDSYGDFGDPAALTLTVN